MVMSFSLLSLMSIKNICEQDIIDAILNLKKNIDKYYSDDDTIAC